MQDLRNTEHSNRESTQLTMHNVDNIGTNANNLLPIVLLSAAATQDDPFLHQFYIVNYCCSNDASVATSMIYRRSNSTC